MFDSYITGRNENKTSRKNSSKSLSEDEEAHSILRLGMPQHKKADSLDSEDRSAYSSIGKKIVNSDIKNDHLVLDYENLSGMSEEPEETKHVKRNLSPPKQKVGITDIVAQENFPDSDKEEENEGSEGIDEGFLQVASAGSCNTGSFQDETRNNATSSSNQDEAAMFSFHQATAAAGVSINSDEDVKDDG